MARAAQADFKILLYDGAAWPALDADTQKLADADTLEVVNKSDLVARPDAAKLFVSTKTGDGLKELTARLVKAIDERFAVTPAPALTRARHRAALTECRDHLRRALIAQESELRAEDLRLALRALGRITGRVDVEDLLDIIFRDFCIGK